MKKVIISVSNDLTTDQRVDKVAHSLMKSGFSVFLLGAISKDDTKLKIRPYEYCRFKMFFKKGFLFYAEFNIRLLLHLITHKYDIYLSNDLDTLLANFIASKLKRVKLIYDSHELFTELPELANRPFVQSIWRYMEKYLLKRIKYSYTVSESIANFYGKKYGIKMSVISNFPLQKPSSSHFINNDKIIIYQGAVNKDRGVKLMIDAMNFVDAKLYIIGGGDLFEEMVNYVKEKNLNDKVVFFGKLHFDELFDITRRAHLGLSFELDTCLSYRYALPNKIFDYIHAEIPVLVSPLSEYKKILNSYNVGQLLKSRDVKSVSDQINYMLCIEKKKWLPSLLAAKHNFSWGKQERLLLSFFN